MSFLSRLIDAVSGAREPLAEAAPADERLASAALLVHVARIDGRLAAEERGRLVELVRRRFGFDAAAAEAFIARAESLDHEAGDIATLVGMIGRDADPAERRQLLATAYSVVRSDGRIEEFEDDLVWRVGRLLGFDEAEIAALRDTPA
jgi:uncharacterized tellurite resistance protein B-like protein